MENNVKTTKSLEDSSSLIRRVSEKIQNEVKSQKGGFLSMLLGTLGARLLGNMLAGKGIAKSVLHLIRLLCMHSIIMLLTFIVLMQNTFKIRKLFDNKNIITSFLNTSTWFSNVWIVLYWVYWFYACK